MRVKICGITQPEQGACIAQLGATALGFICVHRSPRYISVAQIQKIVKVLPGELDKIGVFANSSPEEIAQVATKGGLRGIQLHGDESPQFCQQLRQYLPQIELIKALRVKTAESLAQAQAYSNCVNALLLDAYHPQLLGGTGETLNWEALRQFRPPLPWLLAGGLTPDNIIPALEQLHPDGIDLSSGVEKSPGDKDLAKVARLFEKMRLFS